ncbi:H-type lectin domain-containing protein [Pseudaestuariivita atlantica]|uniref:ATP synthase n=1 Tax=Pseudaestuariivita atlantica TaxID=1317121 RepID=A0A0L1JMF3_9RHOB|nr:H-type lectin domain-containing protein [Pseudaestuariivita atlantica]KNG92598.1 ATP synthase [Pseudaestuariivita atlantica]
MKIFTGRHIAMDQGRVDLFSDFEDGGEMWTGSGDRERRRTIVFAEPFGEEPMVHVSLSLWDMDSRSNARAEVRADRIRKDRFDVVFSTWGDSRIARVHVSWLAIGALASDDDWDVG